MWLLYIAVPILVPAMLAFMFWRVAFRMRRDRARGEQSAKVRHAPPDRPRLQPAGSNLTAPESPGLPGRRSRRDEAVIDPERQEK